MSIKAKSEPAPKQYPSKPSRTKSKQKSKQEQKNGNKNISKSSSLYSVISPKSYHNTYSKIQDDLQDEKLMERKDGGLEEQVAPYGQKDEDKCKNSRVTKNSRTSSRIQNNNEVIKFHEKEVKDELDRTELMLKNRDESLEKLHAVVNNTLLNIIVQIYDEHCQTLSAQAARIVLQIYSHYPVRDKLYIYNNNSIKSKSKNVNPETRISYAILPLLLHNYSQVNQSAAIECIQGLTKEGGVDIIQNFSKLPFYKLNTYCIATDCNMIISNVRELINKWNQSINSTFINGVLQLIMNNINNYYNRNTPDNNIYDIILKQLTVQLTAKLTTVTALTNSSICSTIHINSNFIKQLIINIFKLYINFINIKLSLISTNNSNDDGRNQFLMLFYTWAVFSICDNIPYVGKNGKNYKCQNSIKDLFGSVMAYGRSVITGKYYQKNTQYFNNALAIQNKNGHQYINLALSLIYPFDFQSTNYQVKPSSLHIDSNQCKLLVIVRYQELLQYIVNSFNIEDNIEEESIQVIIKWVFQLAIFCDEMKKKHKLETVLNSIAVFGLVGEGHGVGHPNPNNSRCSMTNINPTTHLNPQYAFDRCESLLYKLLISIQKSLPKYSLKYYSHLYIERPGIFHLYFIDEILFLRQVMQVKYFMIDLVQKWINIEMRDFNMLGYVCKFFMYFLDGSKRYERGGKKEDGFRILLSFFRELKYETLIHLNTIFYQASFSDSTAPQTQVNHYHIQSISNLVPTPTKSTVLHSRQSLPLDYQQGHQIQPQPILLPSNLPPLTLSTQEQQSQLKSCGYSYSQKTIFLDRHFYLPEELLHWGSTLLHEIYDDEYYYHCKYFYYLLTSAYSMREGSARMNDHGKSSKKSDKNKISNKDGQMKSSVNIAELVQQLSVNIQKIISFWEQCILKNKIAPIYSIFQMLMCWSLVYIPTMNNSEQQPSGESGRGEHSIKQSNIKQILRIVLEHHEKFLLLPQIYAQNWKEAIKQMQNNVELFDKYKKQENKIKNRQLYLLRCIIQFVEQLSTNKIHQLIPKHITYEQVIEIIQKYSVYSGGVVCWRSIRVLSSRTGKNIFLEEAHKVINGCKSDSSHGKGNKKKMQLYRQLLFAYIQQQPSLSSQQHHINKLCSTHTKNKSGAKPMTLRKINKIPLTLPTSLKNSQDSLNSLYSLYSQNSKNSQNISNINDINKLMEFQLKVNVINMIRECIDILSEVITQSKPNIQTKQQHKLQLKNAKQQLHSKHLALQILHQLYKKSATSTNNAKTIHQVMSTYPYLSKQLNHTLLAILFRESSIVTKYQRKLILSMRGMCLNWIASSQYLESGLCCKQVGKGKDKNIVADCHKDSIGQKCIGVLNKVQIYLVLWHYVLDEEIQLRIQVISILTNIYKSESFSWIKKQWYWYCAILTLIKALQPKQKIKIYIQKCIQYLSDKIAEKYQNSSASFLLNLGLVIGFLIYNSKTNLPCIDIFDIYCTSWLKGNKDVSYLIISALEIIERQGLKFVEVVLGSDGSCGGLGKDLKLFYMNVKKKRGWIICQAKIDYNYVKLQSKSEMIFRYLKETVLEKFKNVKFLKAKKECVFDISQIFKIGDIAILERLSPSEMKERQTKLKKNNDNFSDFGVANQKTNYNSEEESEIDIDQFCDF